MAPSSRTGPGSPPSWSPRGPGKPGIKLLGGAPGADPGTAVRLPARLDLARLAGDGALRVFVAHSYPLSQVADAHRYSMAGHATGKIVLIP